MEPSNTSTLISQVVSSVIGENVANIDPVALKADSAIKQSIAIRTGDQKLLQEARIQQSIADRLGARNALMHKMPPVALELGDKDPVTMKAHSAIKRSIADRTGNLQLLEEAKQEQSAADRLGARSALSQSREDGSQSPIIDEATRADGGRSPQRSPTIKPEPLDRSPVFGSTKAKRGSPIVEKATANGAYRLSQQKMDSYERERGNNRLDRNRNNSGSRDLNKAARPSGTANAQTSSAPIQDLLKMRRRSLSADDATNGFVQWRQNAALAQQLAQNPDPTALKRDAALKQSLAARVGDQALMKQARIEQSLADKMGGRQALMHIANPAPTSPTATSPPPPQQQQPLVVKHEVRQPPTTLVDNFAGQKVGPTRANIQKQIQKNIFKIAPIEGELAQKLEVVKRRMSQDLNPEESTAAQLAQLALRKTPLVRSRSQDYSGEPLPSISEEVNEPYSFDGLPDEAERSQPAVGTVDAEVHNEAHAGGVFGMVTGLMSSLAGKVLGRDSETTAVPKDAEDP